MVISKALFLVAALAIDSASAQLDVDSLATKYFGNDKPWYQARIPFFEASDSTIQDVYYYRWKVWRAHQRDLGANGFITTEFLDDVSWQLEPWASLNDATGFHIGDGRWLRDRRYTNDYIVFMNDIGNDRHFTDWIADGTWGRYLVDGDQDALLGQLDGMIDLYNQWDDAFDDDKGLYWREPIADATEYTIGSIDASGGQDGFLGGFAFRPSINSYMFANAMAISNTAKLAGQDDVATDFENRATTLKSRFQADIWNETLSHFIDRYQRATDYVQFYEPIRGRELVGYVPWMFSMPDDTDEYNSAWQHLRDTAKFNGPSGMRTNEPSYQYYMRQYRYDAASGGRECQWNGPVWPYQTSQVLYAIANVLNKYDNSYISKSDYLAELQKFSKLHYTNGTIDLQEDYEPDKEGPIVGLARSHHYSHSSYVDLIISGLVGIRARADNTLEVNPLVPAGEMSYFRLQDVPYHGRNITVTWDADGSRYGATAGLTVEIDGEVVAQSDTIERLTATFDNGDPFPITDTRIAKSIQLQSSSDYPKGSVSNGNDSEGIHDAIDGRIWFFSELPNGWDSVASSSDSDEWYTIDFGSATDLTGGQLAFFTDDDTFVLPTSYSIQTPNGGNWVDVETQGGDLVANGVRDLTWDSVSTSQLRLAFTQPANKRVRLVEFKAF